MICIPVLASRYRNSGTDASKSSTSPNIVKNTGAIISVVSRTVYEIALRARATSPKKSAPRTSPEYYQLSADTAYVWKHWSGLNTVRERGRGWAQRAPRHRRIQRRGGARGTLTPRNSSAAPSAPSRLHGATNASLRAA